MDKLILSVSPHLRAKTNTTIVMLDVVIALMPALVMSAVVFGLRALLLVAVCVATSVLAEFLFGLLCKKPCTVGDLSAVVTGILLAFNLPVGVPVWQAVIGSIVAIIVVKQLFGGLGMNFANPAIVGRIFMFLAFSGTMSNYQIPNDAGELVATATPLVATGDEVPTLLNLFLGNNNGCIGETCAVALIAGGIYLMVRKVISFHIPVVFIGTVFVLSLLVVPEGQTAINYALYQILSGGLMLGAIFMATDYVTSPYTKWGKVIFALGCGLITFAIRQWGSYPEGVSFSILFMNILTPYINNWTATKPFGGAK
ncbi:MAG: RnfABCDGE type electron transport complex subunit D [Clostridia bacterium]|nr:RnfABCDGE type electron transport complex subunit D [Clostridia bacterium]